MTCLIVSPRLGRLSAVPLVTDVVHPLLRLLSLMKMSPWILTLV